MGITKEYDETKNNVEEGLKAVTAERESLPVGTELVKYAVVDSVHTDETLSFKTSGNEWDRDQQIENALPNIACAAHMANRAYCIALGDNSQPLWEDAPDWQQSSAKNGVRAILKNPDTTPEQSHEGWLKQKTEEGWKYGAVKDPEKKEHPCFLPYAELPEAQRVKDAIFGATVRSMAKVHGSL
jgi:hypothetical protein